MIPIVALHGGGRAARKSLEEQIAADRGPREENEECESLQSLPLLTRVQQCEASVLLQHECFILDA